MNQAIAVLSLLRPRQWVKNVFILAPLCFAFRFTDIDAIAASVVAVACFMFLSSAVYILNDLLDIDEDRMHPKKKYRPLASGLVSIPSAIIFGFLLLGGAFSLGMLLPIGCLVVMLIYSLLMIAYSLWLKHVAVLDVVVIAAGFVLRVEMGATAIDVVTSPWIILTTFLVSLFLGFGKRYNELSIRNYSKSRHSLRRYNRALLDRLMSISCGATLLCYSLYTVETARLLNKTELVYTVAFVAFGLFRYLQIVYVDGKSGEPERALFRDRLFFVNGIIWFAVTLWLLR